MIDIEWKESSLKSFYHKMDKIIANMEKSAKLGIENALKNTQQLAIQIKPQGKSNDGILIELLDTEKNMVQGRVYTDVKTYPYLVYLEFGTGIYADPEGGGSRAKKIPWYVHTSMADLSMYGYPTITFKDENGVENTFYVVYGMHAHPYMRPASFQSRDSNVEQVEKAISDMIRSVIK